MVLSPYKQEQRRNRKSL